MNRLVQPAKQDRSRNTQNRILRATEKLLREASFEAVSVRQIIKESNTSIGSFYGRFRDKNALLPVLYAEYEDQLQERLVRLRKSIARARSLETAAGHIVQHFLDTYGEIPNLSRALYDYATRSPEATESRKLAERRYGQYAFLLDALLSYRAEITHANPSRAVELAVYFMVVVCRNRLLYPLAPQTRMMRISRRELKLELVRQLTGYLRHA